MSRRPILIALALSSGAPQLVYAQTAAADAVLPDVTVSATREPTPLAQVGSSVQVITGQEIQQKQRRTLPDILADSPGLSVVRTGGPGSQTSVFIRGTNANQTKVRIDGMDANDPTTPNGAFDFGPVLANGIARIEVLRGPQSGLYGADAIGGVIDITTPKGEGPLSVGGSLEGGSFQTFNQDVYLRGSTGPFSYYFDVAHFRAPDTPATPEGLVPPGQRVPNNYFNNTTLSTRLGYQVTDNFDVGVVARYSDSNLRFVGDDNSVFPSHPASELSQNTQRQLVARGTAHLVLFDGVFGQTLGLGYAGYNRRAQGPAVAGGLPPDPTRNNGDNWKLDWRGDVRLGSLGTLVLGAEHLVQEIRDSPVTASITTNAGYGELVLKHGRLSGALNLRYDSNSRYGGHTTWRVAPAFAIPETGTILKASAGTGFKAPTLNQLFVSFPSFNFFANPNLKPEESVGFDAGVEQSLFGNSVRLGVTYYQNNIDNLITTNATFTSYGNINKATTSGFEAFAVWQPTSKLTLRADYTNTVTKDDQLNQELLRRPRNKISVNAGWQATERLFLGSTLLYVSSRIDGNRNFTVARQRANGFFTADLTADYKITENVSLFARVNNLLDRTYESPSGYLQPGISAFGGVRVGI